MEIIKDIGYGRANCPAVRVSLIYMVPVVQ